MNMRDMPWLAVLAVMLLVGSPAFAQKSGKAAAPLNEQRVALVIGNSTYKESPLANPVNDAADIAQALQNAGFKVILKRNANTRDMRQAIREFANELRRAQVGLFYFAGHGVQVKGANYLVPVGADIQSEADAEDLSVDANFVLRTMEDAQTKVSIVILDACRNNPYARSFRSTSRGLAQMTAATGSIVAFATAPGSVAADGTGRNGIYTKHLLESLRQPDTDILKVFQRTRAAVVKETRGKQTPWESTSLIGDFYFRTPVGGSQGAGSIATSPATDPATVEFAFWESVKNSKSADEINAYLEQYPNGRFAGLARARLKLLQTPSQQITLAPPSTTVTRPTIAPGKIGTPATSTVTARSSDAVAAPVSQASDRNEITVVENLSLDIGEIYSHGLTAPSTVKARFSLSLVFLENSGWNMEIAFSGMRRALGILGQCGILADTLNVHVVRAPVRFASFSIPIAKELVPKLNIPRPTIYFVWDSLQPIRYDAEVIALDNSLSRPELRDTVWITANTRELAEATARMLMYLLLNRFVTDGLPGSLFQTVNTQSGSSRISEQQCDESLRVGQKNGLLRIN